MVIWLVSFGKSISFTAFTSIIFVSPNVFFFVFSLFFLVKCYIEMSIHIHNNIISIYKQKDKTETSCVALFRRSLCVSVSKVPLCKKIWFTNIHRLCATAVFLCETSKNSLNNEKSMPRKKRRQTNLLGMWLMMKMESLLCN